MCEKARSEREYGEGVLQKWQEAKDKIGTTVTPTGLRLPRLALPDLDEAGEIARFMWDEGLPGEFPFLTAAYPEQYLEPESTESDRQRKATERRQSGKRRTDAAVCGVGSG